MSELFWNILLVPNGYEHIRIKHANGEVEEGTYPAGYMRHLTFGDSVLTKFIGKRWIQKFKVCVFRGKPAIKFGKKFGARQRYVRLDTLPYVPKRTYGGKVRKKFLEVES